MNLKRFIIFVLCVLLCSVFAGCSAEETAKEATQEATMPLQQQIDVDLTQLSSTMVYSEVYNMMISPKDYVGKTVKMRGQFAQYTDTETGKTYYSVIIADAAACCQQGMEFVLNRDYKYPDDYPEPGQEIEVTGEFQTYKEGELTYCRLASGILEII
ncbi:MAG: hypothetical protein ACI4RF_04010 [Eubacterium sp.]